MSVVVSGNGAHVVVDPKFVAEVLLDNRGQIRVQLGADLARRIWLMTTPDDHRYRTHLAFRNPAEIVVEEPLGQLRCFAQVTVGIQYDLSLTQGDDQLRSQDHRGNQADRSEQSPPPLESAVSEPRREAARQSRS